MELEAIKYLDEDGRPFMAGIEARGGRGPVEALRAALASFKETYRYYYNRCGEQLDGIVESVAGRTDTVLGVGDQAVYEACIECRGGGRCCARIAAEKGRHVYAAVYWRRL